MENVNKCPKDIDLGIKIYFRKFLWEKEKKKWIITANPPVVRPVFTLPTRDLKLYTLPT